MGASAEVITPGQFPATDKTRVDFGNSDDTSIDPAFVLAPEFRPGRRQEVFENSNGVLHSSEGVPLLDFSVLRFPKHDVGKSEVGNGAGLEHGRSRKLLVEEVGRACQDWGFFQVINHGVEAGLLDEVEAEMKSFFALPRNEKLRVARTDDNPTVGYYDSELTKNVRDWKEVYDFTVKDTVTLPKTYDDEGVTTAGERVYSNSWPSNPPRFRGACKRWSAAMEKLSFELLELITESMGLPATYFHKHFRDNNTTFVRLNHYPECPRPELALGVSRHKDGGALTVLWQDETGGLEVRRKDGEWMGVKPRRDAFIINVGDLFQVWSNNKYKSVEHRATVNQQKDRYSIPYFFNPAHTTQISPAPELTDEKTNPPRYRPYSWGYFLHRRKFSNMNRVGENIQIHHFAIN